MTWMIDHWQDLLTVAGALGVTFGAIARVLPASSIYAHVLMMLGADLVGFVRLFAGKPTVQIPITQIDADELVKFARTGAPRDDETRVVPTPLGTLHVTRAQAQQIRIVRR